MDSSDLQWHKTSPIKFLLALWHIKKKKILLLVWFCSPSSHWFLLYASQTEQIPVSKYLLTNVLLDWLSKTSLSLFITKCRVASLCLSPQNIKHVLTSLFFMCMLFFHFYSVGILMQHSQPVTVTSVSAKVIWLWHIMLMGVWAKNPTSIIFALRI